MSEINHWHALLSSEVLLDGITVPARYAGVELVVWRNADGGAVVQEAICPHLGAHLAYNGIVENGELSCRFHGWCWHADGSNAGVPYSKAFPKLDLDVYQCCERDGQLWLRTPLLKV